MEENLTVRALVHNTLQTVRKAALPLVQIIGGGQALILLLSVVCLGATPFGQNMQEHPIGYTIWSLCSAFIGIIIMTSSLITMETAREGNLLTWKEALKAAWHKVWAVLGATIYVTLLVWAAAVLLAIVLTLIGVGIYFISSTASIVFAILAGLIMLVLVVVLAVYVAFSLYAVALSHTTVWNAPVYVYRLLKGRTCHTLLLCIVSGIAIMLLGLATGIIQVLLTPLYLISLWLGMVVMWLFSLPIAVLNGMIGLGCASEIYHALTETTQNR